MPKGWNDHSVDRYYKHLVSHWRCDDTGTTLTDSVGSNDGTLQDNVEFVSGGKFNKCLKFGYGVDTTDGDKSSYQHHIVGVGALSFDSMSHPFCSASTNFGNSNSIYVTVPNHEDFNIGTGDFCLEGWFRFSSVLATNIFFEVGNLRIYYTTAGTRLTVRAISSLMHFAWNPVSASWYHIVVDRKDEEIRVFINGTQIGLTTDSTHDLVSDYYGLFVGRNSIGVGTSHYNGHANEIRFSKVSRYTSNFTAPSSKYSSDSNTLLLWHGEGGLSSEESTVDFGSFPANSSLAFDNGDGFTISFWMKPELQKLGCRVIGYDNKDNSSPFGWQFVYETGNTFRFYLKNKNLASLQTQVSISGFSEDWHFIVLRYDNFKIDVFLDGAYSNSLITGYPEAHSTNNNIVWGGNIFGSTNYYKGLLDEVSCWNCNLDNNAILALYNNNQGKEFYDKVAFPYEFNNEEIDRFSENLVAAYNMHKSERTIDEPINNLVGYVYGNPEIGIESYTNTAKGIYFNAGDYCFADGEFKNKWPSGNITISYWYRLPQDSIPFGWGHGGSEWFVEHVESSGLRIVSNDVVVWNNYTSFENNNSNWHHIVLSRSSGSWTVYHDGELVTPSSSHLDSYSFVSYPFNIGGQAENKGSSGIDGGSLSELFIWSEALDQAAASAFQIIGEAKFFKNKNVFFDNDELREYNNLLVSVWKFDRRVHEVCDEVSANHGVNHDCERGAEGVDKQCFVFYDNSYVSVENNSSYKPSKITVSVWAHKDNWVVASKETILSCLNTSGYEIAIPVGSGIVFGVKRNDAIGDVSFDPSTLFSGWHHFAFTFDGRYLKGFIDGVLVGTNDAGDYYPIQYIANDLIFGASAGAGSNPSGDYFTGKIDEIYLWETSLSDGCISYLYGIESSSYKIGKPKRQGFNDITLDRISKDLTFYMPLYETTGNYIDLVGGAEGVVHGDVTRGVSSNVVNSPVGIQFNASNGRVVVDNREFVDFGKEEVSASFWFRTDFSTGSRTALSFCQNHLPSVLSGDNFRFQMSWNRFQNTTTHPISYETYMNTSTTAWDLLRHNMWHHCVYVKKAGRFTFYINGLPFVNTGSEEIVSEFYGCCFGIGNVVSTATDAGLGAVSGARICDVMFWKRALEQEEIERLFNHDRGNRYRIYFDSYDLQPWTKSLLGVWNFNETNNVKEYVSDIIPFSNKNILKSRLYEFDSLEGLVTRWTDRGSSFVYINNNKLYTDPRLTTSYDLTLSDQYGLGCSTIQQLESDFDVSVEYECFFASTTLNRRSLVYYYDRRNFIKIHHVRASKPYVEPYCVVDGILLTVSPTQTVVGNDGLFRIKRTGSTFGLYHFNGDASTGVVSVSASSIWSSNTADRGNDGDYVTTWRSSTGDVDGAWWKIDFGVDNEKQITGYEMYTSVSTNILTGWQIHGSDDDFVTFDVLDTQSDQAIYNDRKNYDFDNSQSYRYYRVFCTTSSGTSVNVTLRLFTKRIPTSESDWVLLLSSTYSIPTNGRILVVQEGSGTANGTIWDNLKIESSNTNTYSEFFRANNHLNKNIGVEGKSLIFNGTDELIQENVLLEEEYSVSCWVKIKDKSVARTIFCRTDADPASTYNCMLYLSSDGRFVHLANDGTNKAVSSSTIVVEDRWYHVTITGKEEGDINLYINGIEEGISVFCGVMNFRNHWIVGKASSIANNGFVGEISNLCLWGKQLSTEAVEVIYNETKVDTVFSERIREYDFNLSGCWVLNESAGNIADIVYGNNAIRSISGTALYNRGGPNGFEKSIEFQNCYFVVGEKMVFPNADCVFSYWYKSNGGVYILGFGTTNERFFQHVNSNTIRVSDGITHYYSTTVSGINDSTLWHHAVWVRKSGFWELYIDGQLIKTRTRVLDSYSFENQKMVIGARGTESGAGSIAGIAQIQIWKGVTFDIEEVSDLYNNGRSRYYTSGGLKYNFDFEPLDGKNEHLVAAFKFEEEEEEVLWRDSLKGIIGRPNEWDTSGFTYLYNQDGIGGKSVGLQGNAAGIAVERYKWPEKDYTLNYWYRITLSRWGQARIEFRMGTSSNTNIVPYASHYMGDYSGSGLGGNRTHYNESNRVVANEISGTDQINEEWHMVTVVRKEGKVSVYRDAVLEVDSGSNLVTTPLKSLNMNIGAGRGSTIGWGSGTGGGGIGKYEGNPGYFDELYIWDTALTLEDIENLYNSGDGRFLEQTGFIVRTVFSSLLLKYDVYSFYRTLDNTFAAMCDVFGLGTRDNNIYPQKEYIGGTLSKINAGRDYTSLIRENTIRFLTERDIDGLVQKRRTLLALRQFINESASGFSFLRDYISTIDEASSTLSMRYDIAGLVMKESMIRLLRHYLNTEYSRLCFDKFYNSTIATTNSSFLHQQDWFFGALSQIFTDRDFFSPLYEVDSMALFNYNVIQYFSSCLLSNRTYFSKEDSSLDVNRVWYRLVYNPLMVNRSWYYAANKEGWLKKHFYLMKGYEVWNVTTMPHVLVGFVPDYENSNTIVLPDVALPDGDYTFEVRPQQWFWNCRDSRKLSFTVVFGGLTTPIPSILIDVSYGVMWYGTHIYWRYVEEWRSAIPDDFALWFSTTNPTPSVGGEPHATITYIGENEYGYVYEEHVTSPTYVAIAARHGTTLGPISYLTLVKEPDIIPPVPANQFGIEDSNNKLEPPPDRVYRRI